MAFVVASKLFLFQNEFPKLDSLSSESMMRASKNHPAEKTRCQR